MVSYNGKLVMADVPQRLLCFEYLPKGSLHDYITSTIMLTSLPCHTLVRFQILSLNSISSTKVHLSYPIIDGTCELGWTQYYEIIKGISAGLHYLHQKRIVHLDLKPANILLDNNMVPKIADFGLSRCFDENQSHVITSKLFGSLGYLAPEFHCGRMTFKSDIYSLGVIIIEILTREKMYPEDYDVLETWGSRLDKLHTDTQLKQLRVCVEVGRECTDYDPSRRPDALTIVNRLDKVDDPIVADMRNLSLAQADEDRSGFELIGRDLSVECLLHLSRSEYGSVASLSQDFRSMVRSGEIYRLRRQRGVAEHWIYFSCNVLELHAYDPHHERWIQVPNMPADEYFMCSHKDFLAVGTDLFVFGTGRGVERTLFSLFKYSILTNSWIRTDPLNYPRCLFASASDGNKAYLAGGSDCYGMVLSTAEVYDSEEKRWGALPSMNRARKLCAGVFMDGKFYVIGGLDSNNNVIRCGEEYDFGRGTWRLIENVCEGLGESDLGGGAAAAPLVAVVNNELYAADYKENDVKKYDKQNNRWIRLGNLPEGYESHKGWGVGFVACGDRLITIGVTKSGGIVELNSWVPDWEPPVWNVIATQPVGNTIVYISAVMSC